MPRTCAAPVARAAPVQRFRVTSSQHLPKERTMIQASHNLHRATRLLAGVLGLALLEMAIGRSIARLTQP